MQSTSESERQGLYQVSYSPRSTLLIQSFEQYDRQATLENPHSTNAQTVEKQNVVLQTLSQVPEREGSQGLSLIMVVKLGQERKGLWVHRSVSTSECPLPCLRGTAATLLQIPAELSREALSPPQALYKLVTWVYSNFEFSFSQSQQFVPF